MGERKSIQETTSNVKSIIAATHLRKETTALPFDFDEDDEPDHHTAVPDEDEEEEDGEAEWTEDTRGVDAPVEEFKEGMSPRPYDSSAEESHHSEEDEEDDDEEEDKKEH